MGIAFPATAEVEGYTAEKAKGHVIELVGGATWNIDISMGLLTATEAAGLKDRIDAVRSG